MSTEARWQQRWQQRAQEEQDKYGNYLVATARPARPGDVLKSKDSVEGLNITPVILREALDGPREWKERSKPRPPAPHCTHFYYARVE